MGQDTSTLLYALFAKMERGKVSQKVKTDIAHARAVNPHGLVCGATLGVKLRREVIRRMSVDGILPKDISRRIIVNIKTVYNDIEITGATRKQSGRSIGSEHEEEITDAIHRGLTKGELARIYGVSRTIFMKFFSCVQSLITQS